MSHENSKISNKKYLCFSLRRKGSFSAPSSQFPSFIIGQNGIRLDLTIIEEEESHGDRLTFIKTHPPEAVDGSSPPARGLVKEGILRETGAP